MSLAVTVPINDGFKERTSGRPWKGVLCGCEAPAAAAGSGARAGGELVIHKLLPSSETPL